MKDYTIGFEVQMEITAESVDDAKKKFREKLESHKTGWDVHSISLWELPTDVTDNSKKTGENE